MAKNDEREKRIARCEEAAAFLPARLRKLVLAPKERRKTRKRSSQFYSFYRRRMVFTISAAHARTQDKPLRPSQRMAQPEKHLGRSVRAPVILNPGVPGPNGSS